MTPRTAPRHPGFFLVGTGRCGSTLFRKLLRQHPLVYVPKETHWIPLLHDRFGLRAIPASEFVAAVAAVSMAKGKSAWQRILGENDLDAEAYASAMAAQPARSCAEWTRWLYEDLAQRNQATLWGDKTPDYGHCMGLIATLFPAARFVHIARDGRDVALSMREVSSFRYQVAWEVNYWPAIAWNRAYEGRRAAAEGPLPLDAFFALWQSRLLRIRDEAQRVAGSYLEIRYEALLGDPVGSLTAVASFLQLPPAAHWIERAAATVRSDNLRRNHADPDHRDLTRRHAATLSALGFEP